MYSFVVETTFFQSASNTRLSIWTLFIQIQGKHAMPIRLWRYIIVERIVLNTCPREMFWLLGCTGLSLSSTTPRRVKFMVRSCRWLCDINVEKSNGYTLYISFELFKIFFFYPYLIKKNGKSDLVANKALLEDTLIAHFIGFSLTSAEISYIQLYLRYNLFVCFCFRFFFLPNTLFYIIRLCMCSVKLRNN